MTTANTFLASSATIVGVASAGLVSFSVRKRGTKTSLRSDGEIYDRQAAIVSVEEVLEIELRNAVIAPVMGASGSTTLVGIKHTGGVTLAGTLTCTAAASTVESVEHTIDMEGRPVVRVTVSVQSSNGTTSGIAWTSA
jgi:hypothetical protein